MVGPFYVFLYLEKHLGIELEVFLFSISEVRVNYIRSGWISPRRLIDIHWALPDAVPHLSIEGRDQQLWYLGGFDDSSTLRDVVFEIGYDNVGDICFEVFEERRGEGSTIDLSIVDADIVGVFVCGWETLLH